jgi:hypothetical protein
MVAVSPYSSASLRLRASAIIFSSLSVRHANDIIAKSSFTFALTRGCDNSCSALDPFVRWWRVNRSAQFVVADVLEAVDPPVGNRE